MIEVLDPGLLTLVQDLGRPGLAAMGVGRSGAADAPALKLANRLVGNAETAAGLELTLGGLHLRFHRGAWAALTGAPAEIQLGPPCPATAPPHPGTGSAPPAADRPRPRTAAAHAPFYVAAGTTVRIGRPARGLRSYLAVRGGLDLPPVLGSRASDLLSGIGPEPLVRGTKIPIGREIAGDPIVDIAPVAELSAEPVLRVLLGPRQDWFTANAASALCSGPYQVTPASNRIGVRLAGPRLTRARQGELPPEGMVGGALQVPPNGQPVLFLADHPVTGGYPVIAVVVDEDLPKAAQARPGQRLRFQCVERTRR
ncbi:biotin-dependent carboxyltransferase family protein [Crossiella sp. SN42]|uniref:5-oxoprolinase subunit C family protein n=1 Tax=Crossiella sp. SN42 TaxID=2944808 RepID=UPI00207C2BA0|nr:biotin-dependent carboxyltransferase family protein [Crossiella sp. SN42]MCO1578901.1 biotin-dependent carboxyltransferase family protein [Crossiella sp. SN42]